MCQHVAQRTECARPRAQQVQIRKIVGFSVRFSPFGPPLSTPSPQTGGYMSTHNGKIGRLPLELREQVNQRLLDNEPADAILNWLNAQPAVQAMLARGFGGRPINPPNLSHWRTGGFQHWLRQQERRVLLLRQLALPPQPSPAAPQSSPTCRATASGAGGSCPIVPNQA